MYVNSSHFPAAFSKLNNKKLPLKVNRLKLARCVMMAGCSGWNDVSNRGLFRLCHLGTLVLANVDKCTGGVELDASFAGLDQSEKVPVSYHLGTGLTKMFAEQHLDTPWLGHVSSYKSKIKWNGPTVAAKVTLYSSKKRAREPDLIGFDSNKKPHILESKGYSSGFVGSVLQHAINQVSQVSDVLGINPATRVACFHDLSKTPFESRIVDPEFPSDNGGCSIEWSFFDCVRSYYRVFIETNYNYRQVSVFGREYKIFDLIKPGFIFGIDSDLLASIDDEESFIRTYSIMREHQLSFNNDLFETGEIDIGIDGVLISKNHMIKY